MKNAALDLPPANMQHIGRMDIYNLYSFIGLIALMGFAWLVSAAGPRTLLDAMTTTNALP